MTRQWKLVGVVLTGLMLLSMAVTVSVTGKSKPAKPATKIIQAGKMRLTIGQPVVQGNLTVFPIYSQQVRKVSSEYLTLEEALKGKLIQVKELSSAEVNRVSVTNKASRPIYLMAGDIILGGQQDREVARDTIVPAGVHNFVVEVFCVEHGRWQGGQHFEGHTVASGRLRMETQRTKEQQKVWDRVAQESATMKAKSSSGTYGAVTGGEKSRKDVNTYVQPLTSKVGKDGRAIGIVVAVNGEVTAADVFADHKLFNKQLPKLLQSYALDAVQEKPQWVANPKKPKATVNDASSLLADVARGKRQSLGVSSSTSNVQAETDSTVTFEAAPSGPAGAAGPAFPPAHMNVYKKKK